MARLTSDEKMDSSSALSEFIAEYNLRDRNGVTRFAALIIYTINGSDTLFDAEAMITMGGYDNYGELTVLCEEIDYHKFPERFSANWQKILFLNDIGLKIEDQHPTIGKYKILITPK